MANISSKELSGLEDILSIEQNLTSKYNTYANMCQDAQLKQKFQAVSERHQQHFNTLVTYLH
ncbi:MAG: spore coat protein [Clostridiales bacterium]|jgi:ferritin-like metal-binding protein YciE|nr:spore coat protein [Clostridiales bacterium]